MKKEELKAAIDFVEPDPYLESRLKERLKEERKTKMKTKKAFKAAVAVALAFVVALGIYFPFKNRDNQISASSRSSDSQSGEIKTKSPFIMFARAIEDKESLENGSAFKTLELNESFPYGYKISFENAKGMSEEERAALVEKRNDEILKALETDSKKYDNKTESVFEKDGMIFTAVTSNNFKLKFDDFESVESVTAELSSGWGEISYYVDKFIHSEMLAFLKGQKCTVKTDGTALDYDEATSRFKWKCSDKMIAAIAENPDIKLSSFSDTITFTVLNKDKTKEVGVVDVSFDDDGNATFTNCGYSFYEN